MPHTHTRTVKHDLRLGFLLPRPVLLKRELAEASLKVAMPRIAGLEGRGAVGFGRIDD